jgi:hypothetical protein
LSENVPCAHFPYVGFEFEFIYMLSGKVRYRHGHSLFFLEVGDSLLFDAAVHPAPEGFVEVPIQYVRLRISPSPNTRR